MLKPEADDYILMRCKIGQVFEQHVSCPCREALCAAFRAPRSEPHVDRKLSAAEAIETKRIPRGPELRKCGGSCWQRARNTMGHESQIEPWSPNLTSVLLCWFRN
jgi:hypothetical protein